ncbi:MAG: xylanase [Clostridia bacterium]|nr:xylanase [Clostridia bacterium]
MKISVNSKKEYQNFEGFGASGAWWAQAVGGWTHTDEESGAPTNKRIAELLYSKENGIGLRIYRYNLGGGSRNSGSSVFPNKNRMAESFDKGNGQYDWSRDKNAVNMMRLCVEAGAEEVILFSNSPPERLTKNHKSCLDKAWRSNLPRKNEEGFAKYLLDCAEHFIKEGIPVKYISPVNEPLWVWTEKNGQEGCHYTPYGVYSLLKKTASALEKRTALKGVKLSACENGDIRWFNKTYTFATLLNKTTRRNCDGIDVHSYCLPIPLKFLNNRAGFLKRYRKFLDIFFPGVPVKMSEWCHMKGGRDKGMDSALECAKVIYEDISILGVSSWQHWIAVSEVDYCDGLIYINEEEKTFELTKRLFVTGNFSKYIPYNAKRIDITCDDKSVLPLSFTKDGKTVVILINPAKDEKELNIDFAEKALIAVTDNENDLTESTVSGEKILKITPSSVTTIVY